jgi:two-component system, cell cycle sensor histidine kinase and response regulator CckA
MTQVTPRRGIEILLVEDSPTDRLIAVEALQQARIINTLNVVENGVEAMAYLRREGKFAECCRPDLVLLDLNLPKKDGREVLLEIKNDPLLKYIPVIVLTTSSADEDIARAYGDHANSYITKPVDFPRFTSALEAIGKYWFEVVTLPAEATVQRLAKNDKPRQSNPPLSRLRQLGVVLLADDPAAVHDLEQLLGRSATVQCELTHTDNLAAFRQSLDSVRSDVLLVDLELAESEGVETYRRARAAAPNKPIIVLVGPGEETLGELCLREGAEDFVGKDELGTMALLRAVRYATARKNMQDQLRRAQRMEAIGLLTSGIAHDFNNLLTVLHGHAELLEELDLEPRAAESVRGVKDASERAAQLTRQLLTFSQRQAMRLSPLDLNRVVGDFSKMLRRVLGAEVQLALELADEPPCAQADIGMVEQVLLNLAINARDAMPAGGTLTLETGVLLVDGAALPHPDAYAGTFTSLAVTDTGSGIPADILSRIWEPFVTTKEVGKGTGLGLAIVQGIVQQHRGWIEVESQLGVGTTFRICLPRAERSRLASPSDRTQKPGRGTECILLVEDEAPVRQMVRTTLERQGYQVLEARSGPDAVRSFEEAARPVDLLLTDMVMPGGMNGRELAEELWRRDPGLQVIFTSGFGQDFVSPEFVVDDGVDFLPKPYVLSRLLAVVRKALDTTKARTGAGGVLASARTV